MQREAWAQATDNLRRAAVNVPLATTIISVKLKIEMKLCIPFFLSDQGCLKKEESGETRDLVRDRELIHEPPS